MATGNHGQLRLPGKFDSLSISALTSARLQIPPWVLSPPPLLHLRGAPSHRAPWQQRLMARPRFPDS